MLTTHASRNGLSICLLNHVEESNLHTKYYKKLSLKLISSTKMKNKNCKKIKITLKINIKTHFKFRKNWAIRLAHHG